ncbi:non-hydrolyzing UDP-N-acetylglucosamine 2-epimerase [candidate division KSB1 bacterium]
MKLLSVVGTRPNFIKEYSFSRICEMNNVEEVIVHTGQHYDYQMSQLFFKELEIPKPHYINEILKGRVGYETATMLSFIEEVLIEEKPDVTLVYGDVNSTLAAAIASAKLRIPVAHIEAGLRSGYRQNPEEINRKVADAVSDVLFPHIKEAYDSLMKEGYEKEDVFMFGDIMKDSLDRIVSEFDIKISRNGYIYATVHREENADNPERLRNIVEAFIESGIKIKFPIHPRTRNKMMEFELYDKLKNSSNVEIMEPVGYLENIRLMAGADKVITDSGGVRREAYMLEKPVISLINIIWVPSMLECGWKRIADAAEKNNILDAIQNHDPKGERPELFGDGKTSEKIVKVLLERYG